MAINVYKWTDTDAPQLSSSTNTNDCLQELANLLKKCLVEGYGSKTPAGWSVAMEGTTSDGKKALILQNAPGSASGWYWYFSYVDISNATPGFRMTAFLSYDITDSSNMDVNADNTTYWLVRRDGWGLEDPPTIDWIYLYKLGTGIFLDPHPWLMVANEKWAWLFIPEARNDAFVTTACFGFGDFLSHSPTPVPAVVGAASGSHSVEDATVCDWPLSYQSRPYNLFGSTNLNADSSPVACRTEQRFYRLCWTRPFKPFGCLGFVQLFLCEWNACAQLAYAPGLFLSNMSLIQYWQLLGESRPTSLYGSEWLSGDFWYREAVYNDVQGIWFPSEYYVFFVSLNSEYWP